MRPSKLLIYFLLCMCLSGCSLWPKKSIKEDPRTRGENQFDPLGFPQDREIVTEQEPKEKGEGGAEFKIEDRIGLEDSKGIEDLFFRKVYRVQFFATKYPDEASQVAESVTNELSEKSHIDYKTPYYWVRLGDCETKEEADSLLEKIKKLGYKESWVVEVEIKP